MAPSRYSSVAIGLHWLIAAAIVFQMFLGWRMGLQKGPSAYAVFQLHKSIGIVILLLSLLRLVWRLTHRGPPLPSRTPVWEAVAARATHWAFYGVMIGLPLTGWAVVSASPTNIPTVLFGAVPWPHLPMLADLPKSDKAVWATASANGHLTLVFLTLGLLALHVAAALKHHFIDKDAVLAGMAPGARPGRALEPRLLVVLLGVVVLAAGAFGYHRARPVAPTAIASSVVAAPEAPVAPITAAIKPVTAPVETLAETPIPPSSWTVAKSSTLSFETDWSGTPVQGRFKVWDADVLFSPDALADSRLKVTVDMASADTGDAQRDSTLPSGDWFDVAAHPKAVFTANSFSKVGAGRYVAKGRLKLRGVTVPLSLPFTLKITGDEAVVSASTTLDRTRFGVGQGSWGATDQVSGSVRVHVTLMATRAP